MKTCFTLAAVCPLLILSSAFSSVADENPPTVHDSRLKLQLVAAEPDIVTPTGIAVDAQGRVLVIESHTHFPQDSYQGPPHDRVLLLEDNNGDGRAERISTFFEGTKHTMNLAVAHDGSVYVATRAEIFRLRDTDDDGKADQRTQIAHLKTAGDYPHNGLSGFAFDFAGNVYFGFGENLGADYELIGSDGTTLTGGGEGGNIYRCTAEGGNLARIATGFWNPFHVCFDAFGRLFTVDNDPDSRPPCRLLHVVDGGDYGYRFRNGRKGTHPFTSWNGELPGTLPMTAGTGEAPSGVLAYESDQFPADYVGQLLITSWGDHRIERCRLLPRGASLAAEVTPLVSGGENFRPVGIAAAPDGSIFFSDWVDKSYNVHGKGRVWKLSAAQPKKSQRPADAEQALLAADRTTREQAARNLLADGEKGIESLRSASRVNGRPRVQATALEALASIDSLDADDLRLVLDSDLPALHAMAIRAGKLDESRLTVLAREDKSPEVRSAALAALSGRESISWLLEALDDADPFIRHAARQGLKRVGFDAAGDDWQSLRSPQQRVAGALLLRESDGANRLARIPRLLRDPDSAVRFLAVQWVGEEQLRQFRGELEQTLAERADTRLLFQACLAALERIDGGARKPGNEWSGDDYAAKIVSDSSAAPRLRLLALRNIRGDHPSLSRRLLRQLISSDNESLRREAVRTLRESPHSELLWDVVRDENRNVDERADAIVGLSAGDDQQQTELVELACSDVDAIALEALRTLRGVKLSVENQSRLQKVFSSRVGQWRELAHRVLDPQSVYAASAARSIDVWLEILDGEADARAGERIFHQAGAAGCFRCHEIQGRGAAVGPNLTGAGRTFTRRRLVESIVEPSREIAPQFTPWIVATVEGRVFTGLHLETDNEGVQRYIASDGKIISIKAAKIEQRRLSTESIMPQRLAHVMTLQEFRDLLAFLQSSQ